MKIEKIGTINCFDLLTKVRCNFRKTEKIISNKKKVKREKNKLKKELTGYHYRTIFVVFIMIPV